MSDYEISSLIASADRAVYEFNDKHLSGEQKYILEQSLLGKKLGEIKLERYTNAYVSRGKAQQLWHLLSQAIGQRVDKRNVAGILRRLQAKQLRSQRPKSSKTKPSSQIALNGGASSSALMVVPVMLLDRVIEKLSNEQESEPPQSDQPQHSQGRDTLFPTTINSKESRYKSKLIKFLRPGIALLASVGIFSIWYALSWLGNWYGTKSHLAGRLPQAQIAYNWVLDINPWSAEAHYNLGAVYEDQQNYQQAQVQYQRAIELGLFGAYNNQARLYLLQRKSDAAIALLQVGLPLARNQGPRIKYSFLKNRGWARLQQGRLEEAQVELTQAIVLEQERSAAHCLLAQVLERRGEKQQALQHWEDCLAYTYLPRTPEEDIWTRLAQQRLKASFGELNK